MLFDDIENAYDEIANLYSEWEEFPQPLERLLKLRRQYNELAPDWTQAPEWAQWYAIDADGTATWTVDEPTVFKSIWRYFNGIFAGFVNLFLGIDWRLCKWKRP